MRDLLRIYRCIRAMVIITGITPKVASKVKSDPVTELDDELSHVASFSDDTDVLSIRIGFLYRFT